MTRDVDEALAMRRLRWRCRRGLLELDLVLEAFLDHKYDSLSMRDRELFSRLLETPDNTLLAWLHGTETPDDREIQHFLIRLGPAV
jgi:antitoxin CptB